MSVPALVSAEWTEDQRVRRAIAEPAAVLATARARRILDREIIYVGKPHTWPPTFADTLFPGPLTAEQEQQLFRAMNWAKYQAACLRRTLSPSEPDEQVMDQIDRLLAEATRVRNHLVQVYLRLGAAIARRLAHCDWQLDELVCEANMTLLRAVERFDCDRGCRFTTYATHALRRNLLRHLIRLRQRQSESVDEAVLDHVPDRRRWTTDYEQRVVRLSDRVNQLMAALRPRDRLILEARYGLEGQSGPQSLQQLSERLGISRERVRQLEWRAMSRLRAMAKRLRLEPADQ